MSWLIEGILHAMTGRVSSPPDDSRRDVIKFPGVAEASGRQTRPIWSLTGVESIAAARLYLQIMISIEELEAAIALVDSRALRLAAGRSFSEGDLDSLAEVAALTRSAVGDHLDDDAPRRIANAVADGTHSPLSAMPVACAVCAIAGAACGVAGVIILPALARWLGL